MSLSKIAKDIRTECSEVSMKISEKVEKKARANLMLGRIMIKLIYERMAKNEADLEVDSS